MTVHFAMLLVRCACHDNGFPLHLAFQIRKLQEKSKIQLCSYIPACKHGDNCTYAHSEQELELWRSQLLEGKVLCQKLATSYDNTGCTLAVPFLTPYS